MNILNYGDRELLTKARYLRNHMTKSEIILWSRLRSKQLFDLKFRRQQPILKYIADFYCDSINLVIEVDGEIHKDSKEIEYDRIRDDDMVNHGLHVLRFNSTEVELELNTVIGKIESFILENFPELHSVEN